MNDNSYITLRIKKEDVEDLEAVISEGLMRLLVDDKCYINKQRKNYSLPDSERQWHQEKWVKRVDLANEVEKYLWKRHIEIVNKELKADRERSAK